MSKAKAQAEEEKNITIDTKMQYKGRNISLRIDTLKHKDRAPSIWEIVEHPGAVVILPIDNEGRIVFVQQFRRAIGKILLELPAGALDPHETPAICAQRELQEETGFKAQRLHSLNGIYSTPGFCTEYLHIFLGEDLIESKLPHDDNEAIDVCHITLDKALKMIDSHEISDSKTIASLFLYLRWKEKNL